MMAIFYKKRNDDTLHEERIAKVDFLKWLNESHFGNLALENIVKKKIFSVLVGKYYDMSLSKRKIERFVKKYNINMTEVLRENIKDYVSFNDFFTRKLKAGSREIVSDPNVLVSPADSKLLVDENVN
ncbi:MAG: phosphatidylserine decarboxylase, partial [Clostridia bacterium]|nr:phosphatidylserine decarboxylase [Clostridia bacterium]